ncbi:MAG: GNAT family N-acetyltransferase [Acidimicrobiia bacterium]|nr:GNAT family N-acetyltransferase [Acidimicrobiia bacterium]
MTVRSLGENEVALYKSLRLRALSSDPAGFGSSHARESAFDDDTWRSRLTGFAGRPGVVLIDMANDEAAGMVGVGEAERVGEAVVWGMWVSPDHRRSGIGRRLLAAAVDWARDRSCTAVVLSVRDGNNAAGSLYRNAGFQERGRQGDDETVLRFDLADPL